MFKSLSLHLHIFANYLSSLAITGSRVEKKKSFSVAGTWVGVFREVMDGWMTCDTTSFFNNNSSISGRCLDDNERLCAMEFCLRLRRFHLE